MKEQTKCISWAEINIRACWDEFLCSAPPQSLYFRTASPPPNSEMRSFRIRACFQYASSKNQTNNQSNKQTNKNPCWPIVLNEGVLEVPL